MTTLDITDFNEEIQEGNPRYAPIAYLVALGKERGHVTQSDIDSLLPEAREDDTLMIELHAALSQAGLALEEDIDGETAEDPVVARGAPGEIESGDIIGLYFRDSGDTPLLTKDEEVSLAKTIEAGRKARRRFLAEDYGDQSRTELTKAIRDGDRAFDQLIEANTRLVVSVAKKFQNRGLPLADLIQAGNIGLMRGAKKYDYRLGYKFSTYVTWWIRQAVSRAVTNQGRTIRIPAHTFDLLGKLMRVRQSMFQALDREPTTEELAKEVDMSPKKIEQLIRRTYNPFSLEKPIGFEGDSVLGDIIEDESTPTPEESASDTLLKEEVYSALEEVLQPREARIIRLRFGLENEAPHTLKEVGKREGITRERVRQIQVRAMRRLRRHSKLFKFRGAVG